MAMKLLVECCLAVQLLVGALANQQAWSQKTYLNTSHTFNCNVTYGNFSVSIDDQLSWTKLGRDAQLETDEHYQLLNDSGVTNMKLKIRSVTPESGGVYFCTIMDSNGNYVGRVTNGLNVAGYMYDDAFEEYKADVIRGVISAASVFVIVVSICLVDRFRYKTDEQKRQMRQRKEERLRKLQQSENGGLENLAMEADDQDFPKYNGSHASPFDGNTHL